MPSSPPQIPAEAVKAAQSATGSTDAWCELALQAAFPHLLAAWKERLLSDETKAAILDLLGERGWHASATPEEAAEPDLASVVAKAKQDLGDALEAALQSLDTDEGMG